MRPKYDLGVLPKSNPKGKTVKQSNTAHLFVGPKKSPPRRVRQETETVVREESWWCRANRAGFTAEAERHVEKD